MTLNNVVKYYKIAKYDFFLNGFFYSLLITLNTMT